MVAYPAIAKAFHKGTATLPSSATVFTAASQVLHARRCLMSDKILGKFVFFCSLG